MVEITDETMKSVLKRFIAPKDSLSDATPLSKGRSGFGELDWLRHVIENDEALKHKHPDVALETVLRHPGLHAIALHRIAHECYISGNDEDKALADQIHKAAKQYTGIDIHPGAEIGKYFFVDHGAGVIIGEQAVIGDYVTLYQGVTLGADGKPMPEGERRHPTLGNHVTMATGSRILGAAHIGDYTTISTNAHIIGPVKIGNHVRIADSSSIRIDIPDDVAAWTDKGGSHYLKRADGSIKTFNPNEYDKSRKTLMTIKGDWALREKNRQEAPQEVDTMRR